MMLLATVHVLKTSLQVVISIQLIYWWVMFVIFFNVWLLRNQNKYVVTFV